MYFAVGTSTSAPNAAQTTLGAEVYRDLTTSRSADSEGLATFSYYLPSSATANTTITEAGMFTSLTGGTMFNRVTFTGVQKTTSTAVMFSWTVTFAGS
jgi:hypothetical protein